MSKLGRRMHRGSISGRYLLSLETILLQVRRLRETVLDAHNVYLTGSGHVKVQWRRLDRIAEVVDDMVEAVHGWNSGCYRVRSAHARRLEDE